jgi:hypothetical protein
MGKTPYPSPSLLRIPPSRRKGGDSRPQSTLCAIKPRTRRAGWRNGKEAPFTTSDWTIDYGFAVRGLDVVLSRDSNRQSDTFLAGLFITENFLSPLAFGTASACFWKAKARATSGRHPSDS